MKTWWSHGGGFVVGNSCGTFDLYMHLHFHLQAVSAVTITFAFAFALGVYRFVCICRLPLRLHLCCVCVHTCIAPMFALVLPCCSPCNGVALGLHLCLNALFFRVSEGDVEGSAFALAPACCGVLLWFRLRLHCLELHRRKQHCFERTAVALACIAVA